MAVLKSFAASQRILICWVGIVLCACSVAQGQILRSIDGAVAGRLIEPPRSMRQLLEDAQQAIANEQYSEAVLRLGALLSREDDVEDLEEEAGQDYLLDTDEIQSTPQRAHQSLMRRAEDLLGQMPPAGLDVYELNYGAEAKKLLAAATASRDWRALQELSRRYFHTEAGYEATYLLATRALSQGRPVAATLLYSRLARQPRAASRFGGQLDVALATARRIADREPQQVVDAFRPPQPTEGFPGRSDAYRIGGQRVDAPQVGGELAWLDQQLKPLEKREMTQGSEYRIYGGEPDRAGLAGGEMPLSRVRWKQPTTGSFAQAQQIADTVDAMTALGELPPPTWTPLLVGDQLVARTTEYLMAIDFETGKQVWNDVLGAALEFSEPADELSQVPAEETREALLKQRIWNDVPYGRISSDGERVFVLEGLNLLEVTSFNQFGGIQFRGTRPAESGANTLKALELDTEGKLLWKIGAEELDPTPLAEAFFLGPPLPVDGRLYVIAELAGDISLLCLDPASGQELWRQQLLAVEAGSIESDPVRRIAGAMPAYKDGILVCPTGNGAVVAVDLASRTLMWAAQYRRNDAIESSFQSGRSGFDPDKLMQRWLDGTPMIVDGRVFVTPIESERLYCFDLLTGELEFPEIQRVHMRYLAGVVAGKAILVGGQQIRAHDVETGRATWTLTLPGANGKEQVSGRGFFGGNRFYVPTTDSRILAIDLENGEIVDQQQTNFELGNLLFVNGHLISQGPTEIAVAYGKRSLAPMVEQGLQQTPNDPQVMVNKAALLIEEGKRAEAIEWLKKARELDPDHEGARFLAVFAMLDSLREDFAAHTDYIEPLKEWIVLTPQEVELHTILARGELQREEPEKALESLLALSKLALTETPISGERSSQQDLGAGGSRPVMDSWIAARSQQALQQLNVEQRQSVDARIAEHLDGFRNRSTESQIRLLKHFGAAPASDTLRMQLIDRLMTDGDLQQAERLALNGLEAASGDQRAAHYRLRLAEIYRAAEFFDDALAQLDLAEQLSETVDVAEQRQAVMALADGPDLADWPQYVAAEWNTPTRRIGFGNRSSKLLEVIARRGEHLRGWNVVSEGDAYSLRNAQGQKTIIPLESGSRDDNGSRQVLFDGGLMVALTPSEIFAVDLFAASDERGESLLWRKDWRKELGGRTATSSSDAPPFGKPRLTYRISNPVTPNGTGELRLGPVIADTLFVLISGELQAIDVTTGQIRWRNTTAPRAGRVVSDGQTVAVASPTDAGRRIEFFALDDGRKLDQRPWPEDEEIWFASGRTILTYRKERGRPTELRLRDVFTDEVLLERTFQASRQPAKPGEDQRVKGCIDDGRLMTLIESSGQLTVWDVIAGTELVSMELAPIAELNGVEVVRRGDQLIVLPETQVKPSREANTLPVQYSHGDTHHRVDGPIVSVSLSSGKKLWEHAFEDGPWGITVGQAPDSPLLLFSRARSVISPVSPTRRRRELSLLAIDIRNGQTLDVRKELSLPSEHHAPETELVIEPQERTVTARIGQASMVYTFVAEKPPEQPQPESTGEETDEDEQILDETEEPFELFR